MVANGLEGHYVEPGQLDVCIAKFVSMQYARFTPAWSGLSYRWWAAPAVTVVLVDWLCSAKSTASMYTSPSTRVWLLSHYIHKKQEIQETRK